MANTGFGMVEASEILKIDYLPVVREQIPSKTPLFSRLQKGTEDVVGSEARFALRVGRNQGVGARANGAALPQAGGNRYRNVGVETKNLYGRLQIDGKVFKAAKNNRGAFLTAAEAELKGLVEALQYDLNRQMFNVNKGVIATIAAAAASTTLTISASNASFKTRWVYKDMRIDIYDAADAVIATGRTITGVDKTAGTITIDGANVTIPAGGGYIVREGARNNEIHGLLDVFTPNTSLYGVDRSQLANKFFNPQVFSNGGVNRAISETLLQQGIDESDINAGGTISLMISTHGVRRAYQDLLQALKRFTEPKRLQGGWTALDYNGLDWVADADCKANSLYMLDESCWKVHSMMADVFDWGEEDGLVLRQVTGFDSYEAFMVGYMELVCDTPIKQVVIQDLSEK